MKNNLRLPFRFLLTLVLLIGLNACRPGPEDPLQPDLGGESGIIDEGIPMGPGDEFTLPDDRVGIGSTPVDAAYAPVYFGYDSSSVAPSEMSKVQQVAEALISNGRYTLVVQGHTDERGSREYNLALGERRALAVRELLVSFGVEGGRIQTLSFGEEQPAVAGFDESAYSMNRRAEFQLMQ